MKGEMIMSYSSLRESLINQGVTLEDSMRKHMMLVHQTQLVNPSYRIRDYRVDPNNPNNLAMG